MQVVLKDLVKKFPASDAIAVNHVSMEIENGTLAVFLGPSGCGKTTTLRMIAGLEQPDSGRIFIGERDITDFAPKDRQVAMVFQNFTMYPSMTVYDNIAFPLRVLKQNKQDIDQRVREAAKQVNVAHLLNRSVRQVSGGEAQRVALARAMVRRPQVFLMDEPLSSLDAKLRVQMRTEIKRLHQETHSTIIFVTHDQEEAMTLGDTIVVMDHGNVQQIGSPQDVFFRPRNVFVANFVGTPSMNLLEGKVIQNGGGLEVDLSGFHQPVPDRFRPALQGKTVDVQWGIRPEAIRFASDAQPGDLQGRVELTESLGSRQLVYAQAAGKQFAVIVDALNPISAGDSCVLRFDPASIHLFDAKTGLSLAGRE